MIATRILPPEEWDRLPDDVRAFCASVHPEDVAPVVVEDEGVIVARMLVLRAPFLESFWMAPERAGNAGVTRALLRACYEQAGEWAPRWVMAHAAPGPLCDTLPRMGAEWLDVFTFMVPMHRPETEEAACPLQ